MRFATGYLPALDEQFEQALDRLREAGAEIVDIDEFEGLGPIGRDELTVLLDELKTDLDAYLAELIAFDEREAAREMPFFGQELFEQAQKTDGTSSAEYEKAVAANRRRAGPDGIDRMLRENELDALIAPTTGPAWPTDVVIGPAWSEARLLALGHAFEQRTHARTPPTFAPSIDGFPEVAPGLLPARASAPVINAR